MVVDMRRRRRGISHRRTRYRAHVPRRPRRAPLIITRGEAFWWVVLIISAPPAVLVFFGGAAVFFAVLVERIWG